MVVDALTRNSYNYQICNTVTYKFMMVTVIIDIKGIHNHDELICFCYNNLFDDEVSKFVYI